MHHRTKQLSLLIALCIILIVCYLHVIIAPVVGEEMRYASVAWRMFLEHNWFIPQIGNQAYLHKTPLLFWLLDLGWWANISWPWPVIIPMLLAFFTVFYTQKLAHAFFPDNFYVVSLAPLVLVAIPFFMTNLGILRFDMMLTLFNVMACYCLTRAISSRKYYWLFVLANGLGLLTKGPVIYIFTIPETLLFCFYFSDRPWRDVIRFLIGIFISLSALLVWWGPIIYQGYSFLLQKMFVEQVMARATGAISVAKPWWEYVPLLPSFFLPWMFFSPFWRKNSFFAESEKNKKIGRYLIQVFALCFIIFSLIKTKESRYLLPIMPLLAIYIAYRLEKMTVMFSAQRYFFSTLLMGIALCICSASAFAILHYFPQLIKIFYVAYYPKMTIYIVFFIGLMMIVGARSLIKTQIKLLLCVSICVSSVLDLSATYAISKTQDLKPAVQFISQLLSHNIPVASSNNVVLDMQFAGRWPHPIPIISPHEFRAWSAQHPNAWVITSVEKKNIPQAYAEIINGCFEQSYSHMRAVLKICPMSQKIVGVGDAK